MRISRPLGVVLLVLIGVVAIGSVALAALLVVGGAFGLRHSTFSDGTLTPVFAVPGVAFRPAGPGTRTDATGWRLGYVIAAKDRTLVLSLPASSGGGLAITGNNGKNGLVALADAANGSAYEEQPEGSLPALPDAAWQTYEVTAFPPLRPGTTAVLVRHNGRGGGTVRVPVAMARVAAAPGPVRPNVVRVSGKVRVTLAALTPGALLSQVTLEARGFADPGGEQRRINDNTTTQRPPRTPARVTLRTSAGLDLAPQVGGGPVDNGTGTVTTVIGFRTPPRGSGVTLTVDGYELTDQPPARRATRGRWAFTFHMP